MKGAIVVVLLLVAGCAHAPGPEAGRAHAGLERPGDVEEGQASYYADSLAGHRTASGAPYDPAALTCAHRSAPFGSRLKVTDQGTGRSVVVRVNDRGPFTRGRVIDLSRAAARELGLLGRGVAAVRVERLD